MPWVHRGILAILTRNADFLLNFGEETWQAGQGRWTKKGLSKIVRHFLYRTEPMNPDSPLAPVFKVRYDKSGRKPIAIDMVLTDFTNIIMPRGSAKTTTTNAAILSMILFNEEKFIVYCSATEGHAIRQLETIRGELSGNLVIHELWGNLKPERSAEEKWSETEFETTTGVYALAKGSGGQIRGTLKKTERPTLIVLDDVDDDSKGPLTEAQIEKTKLWVKRNVEPALPKIKGSGRIFSLGTIIHPDCFVISRTKDPKYTTIRFGAVDPDGDALWNEYMTLEKVQAERDSFAADGKLFEFGLEYMSTVNMEDKLSFKSTQYKKYRYYSPPEAAEAFTARALMVDPAISEDRRADYCAFGVVGMTPTGYFHILDTYLQRGMSPRDQVNKFFELSNKWKATHHGVESVAYQKALVHLIKEDMFRTQKRYFEINDTFPGGKKNKILRVEGILQPRYAAGVITSNEPFPLLEGQLQDWPHGKLDGPDVIAMCIALLDPFAALAASEENRKSYTDEPTMVPLDNWGGAP